MTLLYLEVKFDIITFSTGGCKVNDKQSLEFETLLFQNLAEIDKGTFKYYMTVLGQFLTLSPI